MAVSEKSCAAYDGAFIKNNFYQADYMSHFELVVFVYCRDLRGRTIQDYVEETYPPFMQVMIRVRFKF